MTDDRDERLAAKADAYRRVFGMPGKRSIDQQLVWADLSAFCRANFPTFTPDSERLTCLKEGRREVFLRIHSAIAEPEPSLEEVFAQMGLTRKETTDD
jgi:hypothetical protein